MSDVHTPEVTEALEAARNAVDRLADIIDTLRAENDDLREAASEASES